MAESYDKQLDCIVPTSTRIKEAIRNLWLDTEIEPDQTELKECYELSEQLENKLRQFAINKYKRGQNG